MIQYLIQSNNTGGNTMLVNVKIAIKGTVKTRVTIAALDDEILTHQGLREDIAIIHAMSTDDIEVIEWDVI
jgi:hypothetical protein